MLRRSNPWRSVKVATAKPNLAVPMLLGRTEPRSPEMLSVNGNQSSSKGTKTIGIHIDQYFSGGLIG
ncbi:hypothetical protein AG1IA_06376 [Rhizoctonia solani AG-1 IA]|uniref:Uncharacterized protein n=1 Tax=Thanatephorus cucumeris (strain AG1-IA) TaxID=983506 RepID=L8WS09_THACA|nr:hypothetical protein AG1IA_06376 [Rhizoctonia solani AG-1 IA]